MDEILNHIAERIGFMSFLSGIIFTITAILLYRFPRKKINYLYGYRTTSSMQNQQIWDFSQKFSAIKMLQLGVLLIVISFLNVFVTISQENATFLEGGIMILGCIYMFVATEKAIKKNFIKGK